MQEMILSFTIMTKSEEDCARVMNGIHEQLVGNEDYINCNIIMNDSKTRGDELEDTIHIYTVNDGNRERIKMLEDIISKVTK